MKEMEFIGITHRGLNMNPAMNWYCKTCDKIFYRYLSKVEKEVEI